MQPGVCLGVLLLLAGAAGGSKYPDGRPSATLRLDAKDEGVVLRHGDGPDECDTLGAREALIFEENGVYHLFYDGAGPTGWLACRATSKDLKTWDKKGPILDYGKPGELDSATAASPWVIHDGELWHMFYVGSPNATPPPDRVPSFPYVTMKAKSKALAGPWVKQPEVVPFRPMPGTYYADTASPGHIVKQGEEYLMFFSASMKRTLGIARTKDLDDPWTLDPQPIVSPEEQIENSSLYYEPANKTWFLFTNHIGLEEHEYTDAIWVYWSQDLNRWDERNKAVVLDGQNCTWSKKCIGMPSVIPYGSRLAVFYDAPGGDSTSHMGRDIGLAWLNLPLSPPVDYEVQLDSVHSGFDGETCWVHPRGGTIPGEKPTVVMTMQKLLLSGSDVFYALNEMRTDDLGKTWTGPIEHETLGRRTEENGWVAAVCDFTPKWHAQTGKLLGTGHVARYEGDRLADDYPRQSAYSWYDPEARTWAPWRTVEMPDDPKFYSAGAGSTQRVDLHNGDILLPVYFRPKGTKISSSTVMRCRCDGETLRYVEHGDEMTVDVPRGLGEPSLVRFKDRFYLTLRNDERGYVTRGDDGLHFETPRPWTFDDGEDLGSYNTQQHWVAHGDGLFLVFTRRDPKYDHVFRHRAPLRIAQVDTERLCVLRATERHLVPERGARLGNFAVTDVNERETWVTVAEWMQPKGCEKYGSDNSVYAARILWK